MKFENMKEGHWYQRKFRNDVDWTPPAMFRYIDEDFCSADMKEAYGREYRWNKEFTTHIRRVCEHGKAGTEGCTVAPCCRGQEEHGIQMVGYTDAFHYPKSDAVSPVQPEAPPAPTVCLGCKVTLREGQVSRYADYLCVYCQNRREHLYYGREDNQCGVAMLSATAPAREVVVCVDNSFWED